MVSKVDWGQLRTNFPKFITQYGANIVPSASIVPTEYPFAQRFFDELKQALPQGDKTFQKQVKAFMWGVGVDFDQSGHGFSEKIIGHFYTQAQLEWPYTKVADPNIYTSEHPLIQFIMTEPGKSVVSDISKIHFLAQTSGMIQPDAQQTFNEMFAVPLRDILAYPDATSVDELVDKAASGKYTKTAIAAEAERLGHELADTITMKDLFVLEKIALFGSKYPELGESNIDSFFQNLRHKTAEHYLSTDDLSDLIANYRYAVASRLMFEAPSLKEDAHERIKARIESLPEDQRLQHFRELLRPENYEIAPHSQKALNEQFSLKYDGYIEDPKFRGWVVEQYTTAIANWLGQDDGSPDYQARARRVIADIGENTGGVTQLNLLSILATKINAQQELAYHIRDTYQSHAVGDALSKHMTAIVGELQVNETTRDPQLRNLVLDFLSQPLQQDSTQPLLKYVQAKYKWKMGQETPEIVADYQLQNYHKNFWAASLEMRTAYLEKIVFPLNSDEREQKSIIQGLVSDAFPTKHGSKPERERNGYAQQIVAAYLDSADLAERRLLATAMLAANMREEGAPELTVGQKLHTVLSHMGPAGGKLMQAIHSHPQTPQDIKNDLASSKTNYDPPMRWEVVQAVEDSGLLAQDHPNRVQYIGKVVGSGSFGITVFNTLNNGEQVADTFLRPYAADRAEREFAMMQEASQNLVKRIPLMKPIIGMIEEARRSAHIETDMSVAAHQNQLAQDAYHGIVVTIQQDGRAYEFTHNVTTLIEHGDNFKRVTIAPGAHFNDLPEETAEDVSYKKAAAKAVIAAQLSLRLSGINTDLDRHGGNIKVHEGTISHFDFGAMNIVALTPEDKAATGKILAQAIKDAGIGRKDFSQALIERIEGASVSSETRTYLNGLKKDFLALGDCINVLGADELGTVFARRLTAKTLDPQIRAAFNKEIGIAGLLVNGALNSKAGAAGITIDRKDMGYDNGATPDSAHVRGDPNIDRGKSQAQVKGE